jgi:hypothetical protein
MKIPANVGTGSSGSFVDKEVFPREENLPPIDRAKDWRDSLRFRLLLENKFLVNWDRRS